jgi:hypothetical protein
MTNRSGGGTFPWLMYTGLVKDVAITTPVTSLRMDWGQGSSTGTATDLVDATLNPLMTLRFSGKVGIGSTNPASKLDVAELSNSPTLPVLTLTHSGVFDYASPQPSTWRSINFSTNTSGTVTRQCGINLLNYSSAGSGQSGIASRMQTGLGFSVHNGNSGIQENVLTIKSNGYVGIGTDNPGSTLDVHGTGIHIQGTSLRADSVIGTVASGAYYKLCDFNALPYNLNGVCAILVTWGGGSEGGVYRYWQGHAAGIVSFNNGGDGAGTYNAGPSNPVTLNHHYHHRAVGPLTFIIDSDNSGSSYGRQSLYVAPAGSIDSMSFSVVAMPLRR